ncbi:MAG: hypothetical protein LBJ92_01195 [Holosporales bacterium]|jgi:hypothetical protein|nr:hypothetical protein [Holosporales bacterium]
MRKLLSIAVLSAYVFTHDAFCTVDCDSVHEIVDEELAKLNRDGTLWEDYCDTHTPGDNDYDLGPTEARLLDTIGEDEIAREALNSLRDSDLRGLVDYCGLNLHSMNELNQQRFREVLILLAPGLCSSKHARTIISLIGRSRYEVRAVDIQHQQFCRDIFFHAAVRNGQLGRDTLVNLCIDAFYAPCLKWGSDNRCLDEEYTKYDISQVPFGGGIKCSEEDIIYYNVKLMWPNWLAPRVTG